jgi:hypothetical protein
MDDKIADETRVLGIDEIHQKESRTEFVRRLWVMLENVLSQQSPTLSERRVTIALSTKSSTELPKASQALWAP